MAGNIKLEIVTPEKSVVKEDARIVVAPGSEGEFGVLIGHIPFLTTLKTGRLRYVDAAGKDHMVFIRGGFAEALPDKVTVLAESAECQHDIDIQRAQAARERAEKRLGEASHQEDIDRQRAKAALNRAVYRVSIAGI